MGAVSAFSGCTELSDTVQGVRLAGVRIENTTDGSATVKIELDREGEQVISATTELTPLGQPGSFRVFEADWPTAPARYSVRLQTDSGLSLQQNISSIETQSCVFFDADVSIARPGAATPWPEADPRLEGSLRSVEGYPKFASHCHRESTTKSNR